MPFRTIIGRPPKASIARLSGRPYLAALSTLCALGLRYPLKLLPVLFIQLFYKSVWLLAVAPPLWSARQWSPGTANMVRVFVAVVIVDALVIPWPYVVAKYAKAPGDPWRRTPPLPGRIGATATRVADRV
ncbi:MAG TPA: hypothetical protein VG106_03815 [Vicinamibacterales bacterium]|nr:hypothetical protein [Vicinamibacterales bacterium]